MEEIQNEGLLVSWVFKDRPDLNLSVLPRLQLREVSCQQQVAGLELSKGGSGRNGAEPGGRLLRARRKAAAEGKGWQLAVMVL